MSFATVGGFLATYGGAIAAGTALVSGAVATYASYEQSKTQKKVALHNAESADIAAHDAVTRGDKAATDARQRGDQLLGAQRAAFASRGLDLNDGSTAALLDQTSFFSFEDQTTARNNAGREATARRNQEQNFLTDANSINPNAEAFNTFLGSASTVASKWYALGSAKK